MPLVERCLCGERVFRVVDAFGLQMRECRACFVLHQHVDMTCASYASWYRDQYHSGIYTHTYEHDLGVARKRIARYGARLIGPVLDIGCGNGAFVAACQEIGIDAEGQDIGGDAADHRVPVDELSGAWETITMHDVLEHAVSPADMLRQVRRLLKGTLIIDFPAFFEDSGAHHWKPVEHLWMLTDRQLERMLGDTGFHVVGRDEPVPGKIVLYATRARSA